MTTHLALPRTSAVLLVGLMITGILALPAVASDETAEPAKAQVEDQEQLGYPEQIERFFAGLAGDDYAETFEQLYSSNPWFKEEDLERVRQQFESLPELVGTLHHHELMSEQQVTDRFVYLWYVAHFDRSPLSFYFKFYQPDGVWRFYSFEYKDDLGQLARDMAVDEVKDEMKDRSEDD